MSKPNGIGSLRETSLHASIKDLFTEPGDTQETPIDGFVIDIVHGEQLIEIQTRNFSALKPKLTRLLERHPILVVYPIAAEKWIVRQETPQADISTRRKSPRRGRPEDLFYELIRIPGLVAHPNFSLLVLMIHEEEIRINDGRGSWRRSGWSIQDRRLIKVVSSHLYREPADFAPFLPAGLPDPFTAAQLAAASHIPPALARRMLYCARSLALAEMIGKQGKANLYSRTGWD